MTDRSCRDAIGFLFFQCLEYCSSVWCSAADIHLKLLNRVVSNASFLNGGVLDCNIVHRRPLAA